MARYSVDYDGDLSTTDDRVSYSSFDAATGAINDRGFDSFRVQDNRRGGGGNLGSFGSDEGGRRAGFAALNEARPVRSGLFGGGGGGLLGRLFGGGGQRGGIFNLTGPRDFFDGGGLGASGPQFQGGNYSGLLNAIGVSPLGQGLRAQMAASPAMAPQGTRPLPPGVAPQTQQPAALRPVQTPTMTPGSASQPATRLPINMQGMVQGSGQTPATGYVRTGMTPPAAMTGAPQGPGQGAAVSPDIGTPQMEFGTIRPRVSRVGRNFLPMADFAPNVNLLSTSSSADTGSASQVQPTRLPINMQGVVQGSGQTPATGYAPVPARSLTAPRTAYERIFGIGQYGILGR